VLTRRFAPERDAEEVWHLVQGAYAGVEGFLRRSLEGWLATGVEKPDFDPDLWLLVHDAKGMVGAALGERGGRGESGTGLIRTVAVAPRARGRGQGRTLVALLLEVFRAKKLRYAEAAAHGPTAAAARVFESAGMQVMNTTERWEKVVGV
jgi:ribosomal protein S18 acetylase RimI-like enzyme